MKKICAIVAVGMLFSTSAFALEITSAGTSIGGGIYKPSNGVTAVVFTNGTDGQNDGTAYAAGATNIKGKKEYATNNSDPKIYQQDCAEPGKSTVSKYDWTASGNWVAK